MKTNENSTVCYIDNNKANEATSFLSLDPYGTSSHRFIRLYCGSSGHVKDLKLKCTDRTCIECRKRTYFKLFKSWFKLAEEMKTPKLFRMKIPIPKFR